MNASLIRQIFTVAGIALMTGTAAFSRAAAPASVTSPFAKSNVHAWAYEEYDPVKRTPEERAIVVKELGLSKAAYIVRNDTRAKEFEDYLLAYRRHGVELVAVWFPVHTSAPLDESHVRAFLEVSDRHKLKLQWWVTLEKIEEVPETDRARRGAEIIQPLAVAAAQRDSQLLLYGHGKDKWFTQPENMIAIIRQLKPVPGAPSVGISYQFHHAHSQIDRFPSLVAQMAPYLHSVNLNGMKKEGPQILGLGQGDQEKAMIALLRQSGFRGPVGVLSHTRATDAKTVLATNLAGLAGILREIGDVAAADTY